MGNENEYKPVNLLLLERLSSALPDFPNKESQLRQLENSIRGHDDLARQFAEKVVLEAAKSGQYKAKELVDIFNAMKNVMFTELAVGNVVLQTLVSHETSKK